MAKVIRLVAIGAALATGVDFPNCEPGATEPASVSIGWSATVAQGEGKYTVTQQGGGGGLFGFLSGSRTKHKAIRRSSRTGLPTEGSGCATSSAEPRRPTRC